MGAIGYIMEECGFQDSSCAFMEFRGHILDHLAKAEIVLLTKEGLVVQENLLIVGYSYFIKEIDTEPCLFSENSSINQYYNMT